jgi:hypothetical protein
MIAKMKSWWEIRGGQGRFQNARIRSTAHHHKGVNAKPEQKCFSTQYAGFQDAGFQISCMVHQNAYAPMLPASSANDIPDFSVIASLHTSFLSL